MIRTLTLASCAVALALPACVIDQKLGETAEDSSGPGTTAPGSDTGLAADTTEGGHDTTVVTTDGVGTTEHDPSTTTDATGDSDGTDGEHACEPAEVTVQWTDDIVQPVPGIDASFAAVLEGPCSIDSSFSGGADPRWEWEVTLDCSLSGRLDDDGTVLDQPFTPTLRGTSNLPLQQWLPFFEQDLRLRVALEHWGMGWNRYAVIHRGAEVMLDLVAAEDPDPRDGISWVEDIDALLGAQPWHDTLTVDVVDPECGFQIDRCGGVSRGLALGWHEIDGGIVLHDGQGGSFGTTVRELQYQATVTSAHEIRMPICPDTPGGDYRFALWALEP